MQLRLDDGFGNTVARKLRGLYIPFHGDDYHESYFDYMNDDDQKAKHRSLALEILRDLLKANEGLEKAIIWEILTSRGTNKLIYGKMTQKDLEFIAS